MTHFREVLKNRNFFFLWLGQIISQIGDRLGQMALIGCIPLDGHGSSIQLAKLLSFTILPVFIIGPVAGVYVDRWDRRRTMLISDFLRTILVLCIPFFLLSKESYRFGLLYVFIFVIFSIGRFFVPAKMSIIPELVEEKDLLISNSLVNTTGMIAAIAGFGIGGIVVEYMGAKGGFYLDAASFFLSAALVFFISTKKKNMVKIGQVSRELVEVIRKSVLQEIKEGLIYFIKQKEVRLTGIILFLLGGAAGSVYIVGIVFIQQTLKSVTLELGFLIMFLGVGLFVGSLLYGRFGQRLSQYKCIFISLVLSGMLLIIFTLTINRYPHFMVAAALCLALGIMVAPIIIASNTIIHNVSSNKMMGKVFSSMEIMMHLGFVLFMFISGSLAEKFSQLTILVSVGSVFCVLGIINLIWHRRIPWLE